MEFQLPIKYIQQIKDEKSLGKESMSLINDYWDEYGYRLNRSYTDREKEIFEYPEKYMNIELADRFIELCAGMGNGHIRARRQLDTWKALKENPTGAVVKDLQAIPQAVDAYMESYENPWIFTQGGEGYIFPWVYTGSKYDSGRPGPDGWPPSTTISFKAMIRGEEKSKTITLYTKDVQKGTTVGDIFHRYKYIAFTKEKEAIYEKEMTRFMEFRNKVGMQLWGTGIGYSAGGAYSWRNEEVPLQVEGEKSKLIVDSMEEDNYKVKYTNHPSKRDENKEPVRIVIPQHPYLFTFNLETHIFVWTHIGNVEEYIYNETLIEKLILNDLDKTLIQMLTQSDGSLMEDIVRGKQGGIFIMATGQPGLGKTLTAEVASEYVKAPLYKVQCSQLGIDVDKIEGNLKKVLERSNRWNAILLIDEADVYIRKRGDDIQQNAIVGVFLRLLEYYKGILFMTSNLGDDIDDAVMSRATAHVNYQYPEGDDVAKIFEVLINQYGLKLAKGVTPKKIAQEFTHISGRDIKNLLKLCKLIILKNGQELDIDLIKYCAKYIKLAE